MMVWLAKWQVTRHAYRAPASILINNHSYTQNELINKSRYLKSLKIKRCASIYALIDIKISVCVMLTTSSRTTPYKLEQGVTFLGKLIARNVARAKVSCTIQCWKIIYHTSLIIVPWPIRHSLIHITSMYVNTL